MATFSNYRVYASDYSSFESLQYVNFPGEIEIVLVFARDYDANDRNTLGEFHAYWNQKTVTPKVISDFKKNALAKVKFLVSIGDRNEKYPFTLTQPDEIEWVENATRTLTSIIRRYQFDGLDVSYERITTDGDLFVDAIGQVIEQLKANKVITVASLTSSAPLDNTYYKPLYKQSSNYISHVVYQTHDEVKIVKNVDDLTSIIQKLSYPSEKLLAGHSILVKDWNTVSLPIFDGDIPRLLTKQLISGISKWTVTSDNDPEE